MEHERRFCGSDSEQTLDAEGAAATLKLTKREKATLVLDKRTCSDLDIMETAKWDDARRCLKVFYVDFYQKRKAFDRKKKQDAVARAAIPIIVEPRSQGSRRRRYNPYGTEETPTVQPQTNQNVVPDEANQIGIDILEAENEFEKAVKAWIMWEPDCWRKLYPDEEFTVGCRRC